MLRTIAFDAPPATMHPYRTHYHYLVLPTEEPRLRHLKSFILLSVNFFR